VEFELGDELIKGEDTYQIRGIKYDFASNPYYELHIIYSWKGILETNSDLCLSHNEVLRDFDFLERNRHRVASSLDIIHLSQEEKEASRLFLLEKEILLKNNLDL
jgi:hypothetical protein